VPQEFASANFFRHFARSRWGHYQSLTDSVRSGCIVGVKWFLLLAVVALQTSCTTLANRRDLYTPNEGPVPTRTSTTTSTTTTTTEPAEAAPVPRGVR
jgi:hypothetical protein